MEWQLKPFQLQFKMRRKKLFFYHENKTDELMGLVLVKKMKENIFDKMGNIFTSSLTKKVHSHTSSFDCTE